MLLISVIAKVNFQQSQYSVSRDLVLLITIILLHYDYIIISVEINRAA